MDLTRNIETLLEYITPTRKATLMSALNCRTRYISVMLENIYQPHNASAVLRSCDAFGVQDVHIVEQDNTFNPNQEISMGSAKWVTINKYSKGNIKEYYDILRSKGYKIVATSLEHEENTLDEFDLTNPSVLVFGNELKGLSDEAIEDADSTLYIPMFGFVESFNISVSVAIILSNVITRLHNSTIEWKLNPTEANEILLQWLRSDVHKSSEIEKRLKNIN